MFMPSARGMGNKSEGGNWSPTLKNPTLRQDKGLEEMPSNAASSNSHDGLKLSIAEKKDRASDRNERRKYPQPYRGHSSQKMTPREKPRLSAWKRMKRGEGERENLLTKSQLESGTLKDWTGSPDIKKGKEGELKTYETPT